MFSPKYNTWWRGWLNPRFLGMAYLKGESSFTLHEAMAAWDYIVTNFAPECLGARPIVNLQDLLKDDNFVLPHVESSGESAMR
jgi:hypothetical protein